MMFLPLHKTLQLFPNVLRLKSWLKVCHDPSVAYLLRCCSTFSLAHGARSRSMDQAAQALALPGSLFLPNVSLLLTSTDQAPPVM